jgi:PAS domain S-box-containing protein
MIQKEPLKRIYWTAGALAVFILAILFSVTFLNPTSVGNPDFIENVNLWAVIWAITFVIVLILSFVLARDLIKLLFEYQKRKPGSRIKGKLVATFIIFSMFPALIMSLLAFGLINRNLRLWFTAPSEQLLGSSEVVVSRFYEQNRELVTGKLSGLAFQVQKGNDIGLMVEAAGFRSALLLDGNGTEMKRYGEWVGQLNAPAEMAREVIGKGSYYSHRRLNELEQADVDLVVVGVLTGEDPQRVLLGQVSMPGSVTFLAIQADNARDRFEELKASVTQVEVNYFSMLVMTTLAVIFGFVWLGTYIARKITVPFEALAKGASELADGNLEHRVDVKAVDELGILVDSFNRMADEIGQSRLKLEEANRELISTNEELDERRRYTETVLQNIATGVISLDDEGVVRTLNQAAASMLQTTPAGVRNRPIADVVGEDLQGELEQIRQRAAIYGTYRKNITFNRGEQAFFIAATATANPIPGEKGATEYLVVLDDLTELIKAEKFAAWQEVARRLAHEIKNPLTPIQLSAERIKKWFGRVELQPKEEVERFRQVLEDGVRIIGAEAEMLKTLVDEFSRFARLPISRPVETELHGLIDQSLALYDGTLQAVRVTTDFDPEVGQVLLDAEQMRRVFVNLMDNSVDALTECDDRQIAISTALNKNRNSVRIEFADNGVGIEPGDYDNLFLPYFSTKKKGTGLGLAIVRQIVSEHNGFIRAEPNFPTGTKFSIDIPLE